MNDVPTVVETGIPMSIAPELDPLPGVFAFLDASLPECFRRAAIEKDFGIGRLAPMPSQTSSWQHVMNWNLKPPGDQFFMGYVVEGYEREAIAKVLNATFRLQWKGCPLRPFLAKYRLYHRDDMADALAAAYCQHKRGGDPEAALNADYSVEFRGLLYHEDLGKFRNASGDGYLQRLWHPLSVFFEEGDRLVKQDSGPYDYLMLVRGDRLVWKTEMIHKLLIGVSLKRRAAEAHFVALGGCKAFLDGKFTWPPPDWINPVTDEEEAASLKRGFQDLKDELRRINGR
jgi:hypothetical protein